MKLALRFTLTLLIGMVLAFALQATLSLQRMAKMHEEDLRDDLVISCRVLARGVGRIWELDGQEAAQAFVADSDARRAHTRMLLLAPTGLSHPEPSAADVRVQGTALTLNVPVISKGRVVAELELRRRVSIEQHALMSVLLTHAGVGLALVIGCGILALVLGVYLIGRPIDQLVEHARRVASGDYLATVTMPRNDELGRLATELNTMTRRIALARDEVRHARKRIAVTQQQMRHADRLSTLGKLASTIAHELGTPLNVVSGRAAMIAEDGSGSALSRKNADAIGKQAAVMTGIIQQILSFARRQPFFKKPTKLADVVDEAVSLIESVADGEAIDIETQGDLTLRASLDVQKTLQVLTNLMMNAIQAMPSGGTLVIAVSEQEVPAPADAHCEPGRYVRIDVRDNGIGMDQTQLDRIFEPFYTSDKDGGTGLGLSVCQGIMREHGGFIEVVSKPGEGSCFSVHLPVGAEESAAERSAAS